MTLIIIQLMNRFKLYIGIIILFFAVRGWAQNPKIDQARVNFIAQKIQLSPNESNKFWPLYNEYLDKIKSIRIERRKIYKNYHYSVNPDEAEAFTNKIIQLEVAESQVRAEYAQKFKQIVGVVKTAHLFKAEEEFRLELVKILKSGQSD